MGPRPILVGLLCPAASASAPCFNSSLSPATTPRKSIQRERERERVRENCLDMEFEEIYELDRTADFIVAGNFSRVALQFPDELLKNSTRVVRALRNKLRLLQGTVRDQSEDETVGEVRLFVMADATYGSCCVDEVGASHVDADCVVHYGHTCLSPTSVLPALFVFQKEAINFSRCAESLLNYASTKAKPMVVLYGLEFAHAISRISELAAVSLGESCPASSSQIHFANVMTTVVDPQNDQQHSDVFLRPLDGHVDIHDEEVTTSCRYKIGGLVWSLPRGKTMEDYLLLWIGADDSAFANVVLTFSSYEIARYDGKEDCLVTDLSQQKRILKRRYYLVEKAKDANIVGILVGTLGVAGYLNVIHQMKDLVNAAGKKSYTLVMGRPNPAKLANFPECDVFIYVSCAQTALLDSKEFLAPVITPFEAMVAFNRGIQWTGEYVIEFQDLINSRIDIRNPSEEAHFSFIQGGYMEDTSLQEDEKEDGVLALATAAEKALQLRERNSSLLTKGTVKSGAEYLATRSYQGLEIHHDESMPEPYVIGRTGKASGYDHEKNKA